MANVTRSHRHEGVSRVTYTPDGALLYSAGSEGLLRVFSAKPEDEGKDALGLIDFHESAVLSIDASVRAYPAILNAKPVELAADCFRWTRINRWKAWSQAVKMAKLRSSTMDPRNSQA